MSRWRRARRLHGVLVAVGALWVLGCFGGSIPEKRYYILDYPTTNPRRAAPLPVLLGIDTFATHPLYRDRRVAYRASQHEVAYYPYRLWAAPPGELVAAQLASELRRRAVAVAIEEQPFQIEPLWVLSGRVQRFEEVDRGSKWSALLEVTVRIETFLDRQIISEVTWREEVPTKTRTPEAVANAMSEAVHSVGLKVEELLRQKAGELGVMAQ